MKPNNVDPKEQAFVEQALAAAARAQRWDRVRLIVGTATGLSAAIWLATCPPSPQLGTEITIIIVTGGMLATVLAKLRWLIQANTRTLLQAIASLRPESDSPRIPHPESDPGR